MTQTGIAKITIALLGLLATAAYAIEPPLCATQTFGADTNELCVTRMPFQHSYYTLKVRGLPIFILPDNFVEDVVLTHTLPSPSNAATGDPQSTPAPSTVKIAGGCVPIKERQQLGISVETGRRCSFKWGDADILKDLVIKFPNANQ
ncbi:MAG: hypothetical protein LBV61_05655 [Burkholderiaceae bacterium]|jgi:hypothetical protein|nr:hypothetical protein [Burkholderiaceae bacterium]